MICSLECKVEEVTDGENEGDDCDAQYKVNQEDSEQNEVDGMKKGVDFTGEVMHICKG